MRKASLSLLTIAIASALVGCGSDENSSTSTSTINTVPEQGQFVDATVEGLYYVSGEKIGYTAAGTGQYGIDTDKAVVTFYLGSEYGLEIGSISARSISTPFEAAGTYERSVNLARLLLTVDDTNNESLIVIPSSLQNVTEGSATALALQKISLDDEEFESSIGDLLTLLGLSTADIVSADTAISHMTDSLGSLARGSESSLRDWAKGSNGIFVARSAIQRIRNNSGSDYDIVIHADKTLGDSVYDKTAGLSSSTYVLASDYFVTKSGSNDGSISSSYAAQYLTCVQAGKVFSWSDSDEPLCDGTSITSTVTLPNAYQYNLNDPTATISADETYDWNDVTNMGGAYECMSNNTCSEQTLTKFEVVNRDDSDAQDGSEMLKETISGTYDPVTKVYTQARSKLHTHGGNSGRIEESIEFIYQVDNVGEDRYVDFIGTWKATGTMPGCDLTAVSTWVFNSTGVTVSGQELNGSGSSCTVDTISESVDYDTLSGMDYWWFTTNATGNSKATLDQLNTTIRWDDGYKKINRFSYMPAGPNWDMGNLVRDTLNDSGVKVATSIMRKISQ
ncbi:chromosome partitioning protein ParA [Vibrio fluvialis]|nr:chromosome partitioning protein ParA [Vibrio fluvialis]